MDVRVVAATNKNLEEEIERGNFREASLLPAERDSVSCAAAARAQGRYSGAGGVLPGRIRARLRPQAEGTHARRRSKLLQRISLAGQCAGTAQSDRAHRDSESAEQDRRAAHSRCSSARKPRDRPGAERYGSLQDVREAAERDYIQKKLEEAGGNVSRAAELLGLERSNLYRKMRALGIAPRE